MRAVLAQMHMLRQAASRRRIRRVVRGRSARGHDTLDSTGGPSRATQLLSGCLTPILQERAEGGLLASHAVASERVGANLARERRLQAHTMRPSPRRGMHASSRLGRDWGLTPKSTPSTSLSASPPRLRIPL